MAQSVDTDLGTEKVRSKPATGLRVALAVRPAGVVAPSGAAFSLIGARPSGVSVAGSLASSKMATASDLSTVCPAVREMPDRPRPSQTPGGAPDSV
ncbi:hypothetical protein HDA33_001219 [Micrococcus endophyticus]|uniref:Uncharacterized protein n=1 Tax=Micrococcus endophyticus TaxID=455343 RepID=A0A7W9N047_9MICC|nr:hypothetical protein [Micrococcus endophyticus]